MEAFDRISTWSAAGEPQLVVTSGAAVALCFVVFSAMRLLLYVPQLLSCWRDQHGCATINLWTWGSWIVANTSTGLYMWIFQRDPWGLALNPGSAAMCTAIVAVIVFKRRGHRSTGSATPVRKRPAVEPRFDPVQGRSATIGRLVAGSVSGPHHFSMYGRRSSSNVQASRG